MPATASVVRSLYRILRDLHLYAGLLVSPFVLVFAVSAIQLNHSLMPWGGRSASPAAARTVRVSVRDSENSLDVARQVRSQIGIAGEIGYVNRKAGSARISFPIESPGRLDKVKVDLAAGVATIEHTTTGAWDGAIYLHKMPGPHNVSIRGNWIFTRLWGWLADGTVYLLLFLSASGIYLWTVLKADRRTGLLFLGGGVVSFVALVLAIVT